MKKFIYIVFVLITSLALVSCGSNNTAGTPTGGVKAAAVDQAASPKVTVQAVLATAEKGRYREGELLVKFRPGVADKTTQSLHQTMGAAVERQFGLVPNLERVKLAAGMSVKDAIIGYMQDPSVEYAEPNYLRYPANSVPDDLYFNPQQWALNNTGTFAGGTAGADIEMPQAWDFARGSRDIIVAVVDSGVEVNHPDLVNNLVGGFNFVDGNDKPIDNLGHGTHVAGIIGAMGNNGTGISGVMWNTSIMPLKFITDFGPDVCGAGQDFCGSVADAAAAIQYAVSHGAKVINASYGSDTFSSVEFDAIKAANDAGVLFVAAAGNGGLDSLGDNNDLTPSFPANYNLPNIISVAATDQNDRRASFSNYGPTSVQVAAPGVYILSTVPSTGVSGSFTSLCSNAFVAGYDFCSGTSMAAPHVAGLAGLLESYYGQFTPSQIRATILRYVDVLPTLQGWIQTGGRINGYRALTSLLVPTGLSASAQSANEITLSWTDNATGEDGYEIERKTGAGNFTQIATLAPDTATYTDSGLSASTTYTYRVRAFNTIPADSLYSNEATATTPRGGVVVSHGGGGGCSIGGKVDGPGAFADVMVMFAMLFILTAARALRRRKR
jgi:serine protease